VAGGCLFEKQGEKAPHFLRRAGANTSALAFMWGVESL